MTNDQRAAMGEAALAAFRLAARQDADDVTAIQDLVANLLHLAVRRGCVDPAALVRKALEVHAEEAAEDA